MKWIVYRDNGLCDVFDKAPQIYSKYQDHIELNKRSFQTKLSDAKKNNKPFKFGLFTAEYCEVIEVRTIFKSSDGFKTNVEEL
jgi:hypothetical protein